MLIITILSLLMAATMGWLALRLLRDDQRRSEARVAALSAALDAPAFDDHDAAAHTPSTRVPSRMPASPQVVEIDGTEGAVFFSPSSADEDRPMFADAPDAAPARDGRLWLGIAAAVVAVALGVAGLRMVWSSSTQPAGAKSSSATSTTAGTPATATTGGIPVELVSLGHERTPDGLIIRGLVRNPAAASPRTGTSASVFLFDGEGGFLGSGRAVLGTPKLGAGDEAAFEVRLPDNASVRRYRVTFRSPEGDVVPHLDRRTGSGSGLATR